MRRYHRVSELSEEHREELMRWAQSRTLPAGYGFRARLMLALAEGKNWNQIEVELHIPRGRPLRAGSGVLNGRAWLAWTPDISMQPYSA